MPQSRVAAPVIAADQFAGGAFMAATVIPVAIGRALGFKWLNPEMPRVDMRGKVVIITGVTSGVGRSAAFFIAEMGATVVLAVRDETRGVETVKEIKQKLPWADVTAMKCDLEYVSSVDAFASNFQRRHRHLHVLINNAGSQVAGKTATGIQSVFAANVMGHHRLFTKLEGMLTNTPGARVVSLSSVMHRFGGNDWNAAAFGHGQSTMDMVSNHMIPAVYCDTKMAAILLTMEYRRRFAAGGSDAIAIAVHPGTVRTDIWRSSPRIFRPVVWALGYFFFLSPEDGAFTTVVGAAMPREKLAELGKKAAAQSKGEARPAGDNVPLYLEPYWEPMGLIHPFEVLGIFVGAQPADVSLPPNHEESAKQLWELCDRLEREMLERERKSPEKGNETPRSPDESPFHNLPQSVAA